MTKETKIILINFDQYKTKYIMRNRADLAPQTMALAFCMDATGMEKLTTREEMHELIFRTALLLRQMGIMESFFINRYFFRFDVEGSEIRFGKDDLLNHIGMQLTGPQTRQLTRDEWMQKQGITRWNMNVKNAMMLFINITSLPRMLTNDEDRQGYIWYYLKPDKLTRELNNAGILADTLSIKIDEKHFERYKELNNNASETNGSPNKSIKTELPIKGKVRKQTNEKKNNTEERPSAKTRNEELPRFIIQDMKRNQKPEAGNIPWPFAKGTRGRRESERIDPSWN